MRSDRPWDRVWPRDGLEQVDRCPVCDSRKREMLHAELHDLVYGAPGTWTMWRCVDCESGFLDPRPNADTLGQAYVSYYTHEEPTAAAASPPRRLLAELRRRWRNGFVNARFGSRLAPASRLGPLIFALSPGRRRAVEHGYLHLQPLPKGGGRLLDVGCGSGELLAEAAALGWDVEGLEPDARARGVAISRGLDVRAGSLKAYADVERRFDRITLNHVIEHVPNPRDYLRVCWRLLKPGGMLYVETPNLGSWGHRRHGPTWRGLEPPRHLQLFSHGGLVQLLKDVGFEAVRDRPHAAYDIPRFMDEQSRTLAEREGHVIPSRPTRLSQLLERIDRAMTPTRREFLSVTAERRAR